MPATASLPLPRAGETLHGFSIVRVTPLPGLRLTAVEARHTRTQARFLHLATDDAENLFSIHFPTPPCDNRGVPHILEHAVLSGSHKFPVRDPFFEMVKMSMATFLNAMTGEDVTYYPVASNVRQDLFNLADIYFDAVFHPLLTRETFEREGHHRAPADPDAPTGALDISGIVYNEMQAHYAQPDGLLYRLGEKELFPDSVYGLDSGGDPACIPDLTYEALCDFHAAWYRPGNALFLLYGDIPTADHMAFLDARLAGFDATAPAPIPQPQPRWTAPRTARHTCAAEPGVDTGRRTFHAIHWLVGAADDALDATLLHLLGQVLAGDDAAPLRKALVDAKLGEDVLYGGTIGIGREIAFSTGVKGSEPERADAVLDCVLGCLTGLARDGLDPALIQAAFLRYTYEHREIDSQQPLDLAQRVLEAWPYGLDPLLYLRTEEHLAAARARLAAEPRLFERLIRERLLDNPHRLLLTLAPDPEHAAREAETLRKRMEAERAQLDDAAMLALAERAEALAEQAGTPNPPEALARLPQLRLEDLPARPTHIPVAVETVQDSTLLVTDVFANGVNYLHVHVDLTGFPAEDWVALPRYIEAVTRLGAAGQPFDVIARRKTANTGGFSCGPWFGVHAIDAQAHPWGLRFSLKALDEQFDDALDLFQDLFFAVEPRDRARFEDVLRQSTARMKTGLVRNACGTAVRHASRSLHAEGWVGEQVGGLAQFAALRAWSGQLDARFDDLAARVERIAAFLRNRRRWTVSFTGTPACAARLRDRLDAWAGRMDGAALPADTPDLPTIAAATRDGLAAAMDVAHCAQVLPAPALAHPDAVPLTIAMQLLGVDYMVSELRFKGNAYGASCAYDGAAITLSTSADPNIVETLDAFSAIPAYVRRVDWGPDELRRAIISAAKHALQPVRPEAATGRVLTRHVTGQTEAFRNARFARLLASQAADVKRAVLETMEPALETAPVAVVASRAKLAEANRRLGARKLAIRNLLD